MRIGMGILAVIMLIGIGSCASERYESDQSEVVYKTKYKTKVVTKTRTVYRLPESCEASFRQIRGIEEAAHTYATITPRQRKLLAEFRRAILDENLNISDLERKQIELGSELSEANGIMSKSELTLSRNLNTCLIEAERG